MRRKISISLFLLAPLLLPLAPVETANLFFFRLKFSY